MILTCPFCPNLRILYDCMWRELALDVMGDHLVMCPMARMEMSKWQQ